jgi:glycosyltransferase involved in cell wall biosynthesis
MTGRRICFVGWGDHVHVERWAGWFAAHGDDVSIVSFGGLGRYPPGVRQHKLGLEGRGPRWIEMKLRYLLWRLRPQIVHVHWAHFAVPVQRVWSGPLVVTAWGSDIYRRAAFEASQWHHLGHALRAAHLVTCDSADLARTMQDQLQLAGERIHVIQWGVDTDLFSPDGPDLRDELGLRGRSVVLSARNFTRVYNQDKVLAAFDALHRQRPDAFLLMKNYGGDPQVLAEVEHDVAARGLAEHVRILGTVPYEQMPALYRTADVTISIPSSDAAPMSLLEAMACGSPAVVCDLPSLREWVTDRETGRLVDPNDVAQCAGAMHEILADDAHRSAMTQRAMTLVHERASQRAHMARMAEGYDALLRRA